MATTVRELEVPDVAAKAMQHEDAVSDMIGEKLVLNMGPSHPATHGVLRLVLELDGEIITKADPDVGYLHRGDEKIAENMHYNQFVPYTDRLDYLAPLANNVAYALAVEKLMGWTLPAARPGHPRASAARWRAFPRTCSASACFAMDVGAMTVFLYTFTEREKIYNLCEQLTGARFTTSYTRDRRPDPRPADGVHQRAEEVPRRSRARHRRNGRAALARTASSSTAPRDVGVISKEDAIAYGLSGPNLRGSGVDHDLRKAHPYLGYEQYEFDVPIGSTATATTATSCAWRKCASACASCSQVLDNLPGGPINVGDPKNVLPEKERVLTKMEELIHHFIVATQGIDAPAGEVYFGAENPKGELGFYIYSKGGGVPLPPEDPRPSFVNLSILPKLLPGHMVSDVPAILGSLRLRDGRVRPVVRYETAEDAENRREGFRLNPLRFSVPSAVRCHLVSFSVPSELESKMDEVITHYPVRSAAPCCRCCISSSISSASSTTRP